MDMNERLKGCNRCGEYQKLTDDALQIGKTNFIIIGESPAKDGWIESHRAFYNTKGKLQGSGRVLAKLLDILGLTLDDIYFTECCKCLIERKDFACCAKNCKPFLVEQLNNIDCNIILPMGVYPTQVLLDMKVDRFGDIVGGRFNRRLGDKEFVIIPIYHTSPLNPKGYKENVPIFEGLKSVLACGGDDSEN